MLGAQVLGLFVSFIVLLTIFIRSRRRKISKMDGLLWVTISLVLIFFSLRPQAPIVLLDFVTVERFNALMISGILLLLVIVLRIHLRLEDTNRALTLLVQQIALDQFQKNPKTRTSPSESGPIDSKDPS